MDPGWQNSRKSAASSCASSVQCEVTGSVSGVDVGRATQRTRRAMPPPLGHTWKKNSPRSCLTELTARLLKSCRRVEAVMTGSSPQPTQQTPYMRYTSRAAALFLQFTIISSAICALFYGQYVTIKATRRFLVGFCDSKVRYSSSSYKT